MYSDSQKSKKSFEELKEQLNYWRKQGLFSDQEVRVLLEKYRKIEEEKRKAPVKSASPDSQPTFSFLDQATDNSEALQPQDIQDTIQTEEINYPLKKFRLRIGGWFETSAAKQPADPASLRLINILLLIEGFLLLSRMTILFLSQTLQLTANANLIIIFSYIISNLAIGYFLIDYQERFIGKLLIWCGCLSLGLVIYTIRLNYQLTFPYSSAVIVWALLVISLNFLFKLPSLVGLSSLLSLAWNIIFIWEKQQANFYYFPLLIFLFYSAYLYKAFKTNMLNVLCLFFGLAGLVVYKYNQTLLYPLSLILFIFGIISYAVGREHKVYQSQFSRGYIFTGVIFILLALSILSFKAIFNPILKFFVYRYFLFNSQSLSKVTLLFFVLAVIALGLVLRNIFNRNLRDKFSLVESACLLSLILLSGLYFLYPDYLYSFLGYGIHNAVLILVFWTMLILGKFYRQTIFINIGSIFILANLAICYYYWCWGRVTATNFYIAGCILILGGIIYLYKIRQKFLNNITAFSKQ
ncbi:MAG: hypothetical protein ABII74_08210 [Elusimicrobiota bacterium]